MWLCLALLAVAARARVVVYGGARCPSVNVSVLERATGSSERLVAVFLVNESLFSSQLFAAARLVSKRPAHVASVAADCVSGLVGLDFSDFRVGMDCGVEHAAALMRSIDALEPRDEFVIKLARVLSHLDEWHERRECAVWSDLTSALVFWTLVVSALYAYRRLRRAAGDRLKRS